MKKTFYLFIFIIFIFSIVLTYRHNKIITMNKNEFIEYSKEIYKGYERLYFIKDDENNIYIKVQKNYSFVPIKKYYDYLTLSKKDFYLDLSSYSDKSCKTDLIEEILENKKNIYCLKRK